MTDKQGINQVVELCKIYWMFSNLPRRVVLEMELELQGHLEEAQTDGKTIEEIVGHDAIKFAKDWAKSNYRAQTWREKAFNVIYLLLLGFMVTLPVNHITFMSWTVPVYWSNLLIIAIISCMVALLVQPGVISRLFALDSKIKQWLAFSSIFMLSTLAFVGLLLIPHTFEQQPLFHWPWQASLVTGVITFIVARVTIGKETKEIDAANQEVHQQLDNQHQGKTFLLLVIPLLGLIASGILWWFTGGAVKIVAQLAFVCSAIILWTQILIWPSSRYTAKK